MGGNTYISDLRITPGITKFLIMEPMEPWVPMETWGAKPAVVKLIIVYDRVATQM